MKFIPPFHLSILRCQAFRTASTISFSAGSMIERASSGSSSAISSLEPLMSANSAVTVLRSPSSAAAPSGSRTVMGDCAFPAKLETGRILEMAVGTDQCQRSRTLPAKLHSLRIIEACMSNSAYIPLLRWHSGPWWHRLPACVLSFSPKTHRLEACATADQHLPSSS